MSCKHGGAAFPQVNLKDYQGLLIPDLQKGMTLRDYFAAKAMQASLVPTMNATNGDIEKVVKNSYAVADWMLQAREE